MGLIAVCSAVFGVVPTEITAFLVLALPVAFALLCLRSVPMAVAIGALGAFGLFSMGSLISAASILSVITVVGMGAAAILHLRAWVSALFGVATYVAALLITQNAVQALAALLLIPCALLLAMLIARGGRRVPSVCAVSVSILVMTAIPLAITIYRQYGAISASVLNTVIDGIRAQALEAFLVGLSSLPEELQAIMTEEAFHRAFNAIVVLSPAIAVILSNVLAFSAHLLTVTVCRKTEYAKKLSLASQLFMMSKVSAVIFIIALLLPILGLGTSNDAQVITVTAENINLMLLPAFLLVGGLSVVALFRSQRGCLNIWVILAIAALLLYASSFVIYPLALFGAIRTLKTPRHFYS